MKHTATKWLMLTLVTAFGASYSLADPDNGIVDCVSGCNSFWMAHMAVDCYIWEPYSCRSGSNAYADADESMSVPATCSLVFPAKKVDVWKRTDGMCSPVCLNVEAPANYYMYYGTVDQGATWVSDFDQRECL